VVPAAGRSQAPLSRFDVAAIAREDGDDATRILERRAQARVNLDRFGNGAGEPAAADLRRLLVGAGLGVVRDSGTAGRSDLGVLVGVGEPHRERADRWVRDGIPHLVVRLTEGHALVGPFVVPGQTACLRCIDAHHTDADSSWPLLVEQYARLTNQDRADGVPEPVDSLLASLAVAWAARDIASYAEGRHPSCLSRTIRFDARLTAVESRSWLRHPACGCAWT
jgi:bacteriocin biosynthesis cyclodehydratase domain-containing protein